MLAMPLPFGSLTAAAELCPIFSPKQPNQDARTAQPARPAKPAPSKLNRISLSTQPSHLNHPWPKPARPTPAPPNSHI